MVLDGRHDSENRHDSVALDPGNRPAISVDAVLDHLEHRVENVARVLRVERLEQQVDPTMSANSIEATRTLPAAEGDPRAAAAASQPFASPCPTTDLPPSRALGPENRGPDAMRRAKSWINSVILQRVSPV